MESKGNVIDLLEARKRKNKDNEDITLTVEERQKIMEDLFYDDDDFINSFLQD